MAEGIGREDMTDEELVKRLRKGDTPMANHYMDEAADRIEALINLNEALVELMDDRDAKLAKAVEALRATTASIEHADMSDGVCCCGDNMDGHADPMSCGHSPTDMGEYFAHKAVEMARATLAEIEGEKT
jgi:hypothetical protein